MSEFNRMTVVAAAEVIADFNSHSDMEVLEVQWGITGQCNGSSKAARVASLANIAIQEQIEVMTEDGLASLSRALVEAAIGAPEHKRAGQSWKKLLAGLRFDGFEFVETESEIESDFLWQSERTEMSLKLVRMLPSDVPELDFREAKDEISLLMDQHGFIVAKGHLRQAISAFSRGEWSSANGELRNFFESYLNEVADRLGYAGNADSKAKRDFLGSGLEPPFLIADEAYPSEPGLTTCWVCGCRRQDVRLMFCHAQPLEIRPPDVPRRLRGALSR